MNKSKSDELKELRESYLRILIRKIKETNFEEIKLNYPAPFSWDSDGDPDSTIYSLKGEKCGIDNGWDDDNYILLNSLDLLTLADLIDQLEAEQYTEYKDG